MLLSYYHIHSYPSYYHIHSYPRQQHHMETAYALDPIIKHFKNNITCTGAPGSAPPEAGAFKRRFVSRMATGLAGGSARLVHPIGAKYCPSFGNICSWRS